MSNEMHDRKYTVDYVLKLDHNKIFIRLRFNGRVFDIEFGPEDLHDLVRAADSQPIKQQYLDALQHSFSEGESDGGDETTEFFEPQVYCDHDVSPTSSEYSCEEDPVVSFAVGPFLTLGTFEAFAPESSTPCPKTLQDILHPPLLSFSLHVEDGKLLPISQSPEEEQTMDPPWAAIGTSQHWLEYPRIKAKELALAQTSQNSSETNLVIFSNRVCWFKPVLTGVDNLPYVREIDLLFKLSQENLCQTFRFPRLEAIVLDDKNGDMGFANGLILSAIHPNHGTVADRVNGTEGHLLPTTLCERWYHDVEVMIHTMHSKDLVWGDVSPNNMIIDEDENVWIIDFGGGYTEGWVTQEDMETKKGDLEGLKKIRHYLLDMKQTKAVASSIVEGKELLRAESSS